MAVQRSATITAEVRVSGPGRILELCLDQGQLGFRGGQYLIVDTGIPRGDGRTVKRPYSILTSDHEQERFALAVRRISGPGSRWMMEVPVGEVLRFSGPWGAFSAPGPLPRGPIWVWATDTGITAALGMLRGAGFCGRLGDVTLVWSADSPVYFLDRTWLANALPGGVTLHFADVPPVGHVERIAHAREAARSLAAKLAPAAAFLVGDGDLLAPVAADLQRAGLDPARIHLEYFFHRPGRDAS